MRIAQWLASPEARSGQLTRAACRALWALALCSVAFMGATAMSEQEAWGSETGLAAGEGILAITAWSGDDGNLVRDAGEPPVPDVAIVISPNASGIPTIASGRTDTEGQLQLGAPAGPTYNIITSAPAGFRIVYPPNGVATAAVTAGETTPISVVLESLATLTATPTPIVSRREITFQYMMDGYPYCSPATIPGCYRVPEDTYLNVGDPADNSNKNLLELEVQVAGSGANQQRVDAKSPLIWFDLFRIPSDVIVISATLSFYVEDYLSSGDTTVGLYRVLQPWQASKASWPNRAPGLPWQSAGCNGIDGDREGSTSATATLQGASRWYNFDVTDFVRQWVAHPESNYGVVMKSLDTAVRAYRYRFTSSEPYYWEKKDSFRPKLTVAYLGVPTPLEWRFGVGFSSRFCGALEPVRRLEDYDWEIMRIGWYSDWAYTPYWTFQQRYLPEGMDYIHLIDVSNQNWPPNWNFVVYGLETSPGMTWIIGNEPEDPSALTPVMYAERYHEAYYRIKEADPTAQVAVGGVVVPTKLRQIWLEQMLAEYENLYHERMPMDAWTIHVQILTEQRNTPWPIPIGLPWETVHQYGVNFSPYQNAGIGTFVELITGFRQWMKDQGFQDMPLIISEYGVLYPGSMLNEWRNTAYGDVVLNEFMTLSFDYLLKARDPLLGDPGDEDRLVSRWLWFGLNVNPPNAGLSCGYNGALYDWTDADYPGTLTKTGWRYLQYMDALAAPATERLSVDTGTGSTYTANPQVNLIVWAADMANVERIAISQDVAAFGVRQTKSSPTEAVPSLTLPPLTLTKTQFVSAPAAGNEITIPWNLTDAAYGGSADRGSKTIYVRLQHKDGTWSRLYLATVSYVESLPTATPTASAALTVTPTPSRTASLTPTATATATVTQIDTPTVTVTESLVPTSTETPHPTETATPGTGALCISVFNDRNGDGARQAETEELLPGAALEVSVPSGDIVATGTTASESEPYCFQTLGSGIYRVQEEDPPGFRSTTDDVLDVNVHVGQTSYLEFGDSIAQHSTKLPLILQRFERNG